MRPIIFVLLVLALIAALVGCEAPPVAAQADSQSPTAASQAAAIDDGSPEALERRVREHAARLAAALDEPTTQSNEPAQVPTIQWLDNVDKQSAKTAPAARVAATPIATVATPESDSAAIEPAPSPTPSVAVSPVIDNAAPSKSASPNNAAVAAARRELLDQLLDDLSRSDDSALSKALAAAALTVIDPDTALDPRMLGDLKPQQRELVERYQQVVLSLSRQIAAGDSQLDPDTIAKQLDTLFGRQPLTIRNVKLCKRVRGYGVYETFDSNQFFAGRKQAMIVYAELDHFAVQPSRDNMLMQQVRLTQDIVLYNETDGLAVWRHEPVQIVDESRNRRRDFFVVQLIRLPENLTVGKYVLSLRVTDQQGGTVDEAKTHVEIVADGSVVNAKP